MWEEDAALTARCGNFCYSVSRGAMAKFILVREDNQDRREAMQKWLNERLSMYELILTDDPVELIGHLHKDISNILAVSLDHDLHECPDQSTTLTDKREYVPANDDCD